MPVSAILIAAAALLAPQAPPASPPPASATELRFDGLWETTYGRMRLRERGDAVRGSYSYAAGSSIEGEREGKRLEFRYTEPAAAGEGWFELSADGQSFAGQWRAEGARRWSGWSGKRVVPEPRKRWLVILEADWEGSLAEEEYAFADMLESYFTMSSAQHVAVRKRSFHDAADLKRWCAEVPYLAEPVVLLLSTHGTKQGITVGGHTIGPEAIAEAVSGCDNLLALHLSGCSMMKGPVPQQILDHLPAGVSFPISGYSTPVAWDASALADFVYLTFLLIRGLPPEQAVEQTHLMAPFTGEEKVPGGKFAPLGLDVLVPAVAQGSAAATDQVAASD